jgi:PAP2 superfamily protein
MLSVRTRAAAGATERAWRPHRMVLAGPLVAAVSMLAAVIVTNAAGVPVRDPDHIAGKRLLGLLALVAVLFVVDVVVRAPRRRGRRLPTRAAMARVRRERWTRSRAVAVGVALVSFYVSYLAYRNLKSVVPLLRPELFDRQLLEIDRGLFGGNDPAAILHALLGTGIATQFFSAAYLLFFIFIPGTLAFALVFTPNLRAGLFYATAQSLNWLLGAASYFLLPSLGPVYAEPGLFSGLPASGVTELQRFLIEQRADFIADPSAVAAQSIGAFASLHVSIFFTGALAAHLLGFGRTVRIVAWVLLAVTVMSTIYLGWHYVLDDVAGLLLGAIALVLARALTGFDVRADRATSLSPSATLA